MYIYFSRKTEFLLFSLYESNTYGCNFFIIEIVCISYIDIYIYIIQKLTH